MSNNDIADDILVINCGSSSLKFALFSPDQAKAVARGLAEKLGSAQATLSIRVGDSRLQVSLNGGSHKEALNALVTTLREQKLGAGIAAIGHRVVHGGEAFTSSAVIDDAALQSIRECSHLAPLHNPANLLGIETATAIFPELPQVAVFDTAFHARMPAHAYTYAIPYELYKDHGMRRYGFHGTSHQFVSEQAQQLLGKPAADCNIITAHLGNGCSATAIQGGISVDTSMGMTPLEGLVMGTRSGDVDPGLHAFLSRELNYSIDEIDQLLNRKSGLLGISELSNDMRSLVEASANGNTQATLAIDVFCYRLAKTIAALAVPLGRVDALVFTGGIGENSTVIREKTVTLLSVLSLQLCPERNAEHGVNTQQQISTEGANIAVLVIPTNEELMIARDTARLTQAQIK